MTTWHESVEGSPDDAPLDETQADVIEAVRREAARLDALANEDCERWSATLALTNPIPSAFLPEGSR